MERQPSARPREALPALTAEEQQFLEDFGRRLDTMLEKIATEPGPVVGRFLRNLIRADTWRVIVDRRKAESLIEKGMQAKTESASSEFDEKMAAIDHSLNDFAAFVTNDFPPTIH